MYYRNSKGADGHVLASASSLTDTMKNANAEGPCYKYIEDGRLVTYKNKVPGKALVVEARFGEPTEHQDTPGSYAIMVGQSTSSVELLEDRYHSKTNLLKAISFYRMKYKIVYGVNIRA